MKLTKIQQVGSVRMILALVLLVMVLAATPARAVTNIIYVKADAGGADNGTSWANAYKDLQSALAAASSGNEIWVAAGTYRPTSGTDRTLSFSMKNGVKIYGGFAGTEAQLSQRDPAVNLTVLSGDIGATGNTIDNSYHVISNMNVDNTALLDGFTLRDGNADNWQNPPELYDRGGGMYNVNSTPVLANLVFDSNYAEIFGGGLYDDKSHPSLTNVTFINNKTNYMGGGMYSEGFSSPVLNHVNFIQNFAYGSGGGMANLGTGTPSLTDVGFVDNTANNNGGGMINTYGSSPTLTGVEFSYNSAGSNGGGMYNGKNAPILKNVEFFANEISSNGGGGGMYNTESTPVLTDVAFTYNQATYGGGMANRNSSSTVTNVTFLENAAITEGGGMENLESSNSTVTNATFFGNTAVSGGAVLNYLSNPVFRNVTISGNQGSTYAGGMANASSNPILTNVILWGDTAGSSPEIYNTSSTPTVTYSDVQGGYAGTGNLNVDPKLVPLAKNGGFTQTMALPSDSPVKDMGSDANCAATDQRGIKRPQGSHCDIGAYEYATSTFADVPVSHWAWSYIEQVYAAGITGGCTQSPLNYCPGNIVTRAQMAIFLLRAEHGSAYAPPQAIGKFSDVPVSDFAAPFIEQLAKEGITGGCSATQYCPNNPVTRAQMAIFLLRAEHGFDYTPPAATGAFLDVPKTDFTAPFIEQLATEQITGGCGGGNYCPAKAVTRDQMAIFLVRTFKLP